MNDFQVLYEILPIFCAILENSFQVSKQSDLESIENLQKDFQHFSLIVARKRSIERGPGKDTKRDALITFLCFDQKSIYFKSKMRKIFSNFLCFSENPNFNQPLNANVKRLPFEVEYFRNID